MANLYLRALNNPKHLTTKPPRSNTVLMSISADILDDITLTVPNSVWRT